MKKENKIWLPIVIVLTILLVVMFAAGIVISVVFGKFEAKKGTGEVNLSRPQVEEASEIDSYIAQDFSHEAELTVEIIPPLENPDICIFEYSSNSFLDEEDLEGLTAEELYYAWNEIYAREGAAFSDPIVQAYFDSKTWYTNWEYTMEQCEDFWNSSWWYNYEGDNVAFIQQYMIENNLEFTPQN